MKDFAVILTGGKQYIAEVGKNLVVDKLDVPEKEKVLFDKVLMYAKNDEDVQIGRPYLEKATVEAEVIKQDQGEKLRIAHFRAKSRYRKVMGFRSQLTEVKIVKINLAKAK